MCIRDSPLVEECDRDTARKYNKRACINEYADNMNPMDFFQCMRRTQRTPNGTDIDSIIIAHAKSHKPMPEAVTTPHKVHSVSPFCKTRPAKCESSFLDFYHRQLRFYQRYWNSSFLAQIQFLHKSLLFQKKGGKK
eukprot:TRINITY_DN14784_c0_g2_i4.p1 TRINITY_DN14784_c0_g2~~TRINITY_DN14784_c0_g2_i4.p1  ORF type:complete len:136 (+),score=15.12 TRINITY_DN14784_c0_g2_i4:78-485(+)